jgi:hypothetical protein
MFTHVFVRRIGLLLVLAMLLFCGALTSTASASVPGLQLLRGSSPTSFDRQHTVIMQCPANKRLIGAGAEIVSDIGPAVITDLLPNAQLTQVRVAASKEITAPGSSWSVAGYAICANPLPGLQVVYNSETNSIASKSVGARCPAGKQAIGAGGRTYGATGQVSIGFLAPQTPQLIDVAVAAFAITPTPQNWGVTAAAICANPLPGLQLVSASTPTDSNGFKGTTASCPNGKRLTGLGAQIGARQNGQVHIDTLIPNAALTTSTLVAFARKADAGNWRGTAFAICATA